MGHGWVTSDHEARRNLPPSGVGPDVEEYHWVTVEAGQAGFLRRLVEAFGFESIRVWADGSMGEHDIDRARAGGLITAVGDFAGRRVAVAWSDFRVAAASFGRANSRRFAAFIRHLGEVETDRIPLIYFVNSAGVSLMEGRTVFSDAFALWPELLRFSERNLLLTCAMGKCLGLAPILFGLGHYRVAVAEGTHLNLTGPEVIRLFFGTGGAFEENASAQRCHERTELIHELVPSVEAAVERFRGLIARVPDRPRHLEPNAASRTEALLASIFDTEPEELAPGWCPRVRLFHGSCGGRRVGVFLNPPERSNNLITVRTLAKYAAGLDLFGALRVPVVSLLDSPGIDPRFEQADAGNIRQILAVGRRIITYPHGSMGVITGRCFGGATTLGFPKVFGGGRMIALRGSRLGVMADSIIAQLFEGAPRLQAQWRETAARQQPGLSDLLADGSIDAVIDLTGLRSEVSRFLAGLDPAPERGRSHTRLQTPPHRRRNP